jgi:hypothetical protein
MKHMTIYILLQTVLRLLAAIRNLSISDGGIEGTHQQHDLYIRAKPEHGKTESLATTMKSMSPRKY